MHELSQTVVSILKNDKAILDRIIGDFTETELRRMNDQYTDFSAVAMNAFASVLGNGGKRLRGSLVLQAYAGHGGQDQAVAERAALAIELIHAYMLVIDDVCDQSDLRRGSPSGHKILQEYAEHNKLHVDSLHFGESTANIAAINAMHIASNIILDLDTTNEIRNAVLKSINSSVITTAHGQLNDIYNETIKPEDISKDDILNVTMWKTARYTFFNPIQVGVLLAGGSKSEADAYLAYADNAGMAFQIQDDVIGMFGTAEETGKSSMDDLREGKMTILVKNTLDSVSEKDRGVLLSSLGNKDVTDDEHVQIKQIIENSGALTATTQLALQYAETAIQSLGKVSGNDAFKEYLKGICELSVARVA